jgi:hypothetical protein
MVFLYGRLYCILIEADEDGNLQGLSFSSGEWHLNNFAYCMNMPGFTFVCPD